jgi:hypothetical protein
MQVSIFKCGPARLKIGSQKAYAFSAKLTLTLNLVAAPICGLSPAALPLDKVPDELSDLARVRARTTLVAVAVELGNWDLPDDERITAAR